LLRQAAQGAVLHNDDTTVKILELMGKSRPEALASAAGDGGDARTGLFTSGVVALRDGVRVVLFFSGRQHAGENLADVLQQRAAELPPPIQMCDALSRNLLEALAVVSCELNAVNPFDYLTRLQEHADEVAAEASRWLPWNYQAALAERRTEQPR
jgi:hypothetical protein